MPSEAYEKVSRMIQGTYPAEVDGVAVSDELVELIRQRLVKWQPIGRGVADAPFQARMAAQVTQAYYDRLS